MNVAQRIRKDVTLKLFIGGLDSLSLQWHGITVICLDLFRNGLPHGSLADRFEVRHHLVHHPMAKPPQLIPVRRIQRLFRPDDRVVQHSFDILNRVVWDEHTHQPHTAAIRILTPKFPSE